VGLPSPKIGDDMTVSKDSARKGFNLPLTSEAWVDWFEFKKNRPVTALLLSEMFEDPEVMSRLLKKEFTESKMVAMSPYAPYKPVKQRVRCRIVDATFSNNG